MKGQTGSKAPRLMLNGLLKSKEISMAGVQGYGGTGSDKIWGMIWRGEAW